MNYVMLRKLSVQASLNGRIPFVRALFRRAFARSRSTVVVDDFDGATRVELNLGEHMQRRIFWMGYCNPEIVHVLGRLLKPGMAFFDVGANIGELTLVAARLVGKDGAVTSFEPVAKTAGHLRRNVGMNGFAWVNIVEKGLSDRAGSVPIYQPQTDVGRLSGEVNNGLPSVYKRGSDAGEIQVIDLVTLDAYMAEKNPARVDVMKIDIEGSELACLKGAPEFISRYRPWIIVEVQDLTARAAGYEQAEILRFLEGLGYGFFRIGANGDLAPTSADTLLPSQNVLCSPTKKMPAAE